MDASAAAGWLDRLACATSKSVSLSSQQCGLPELLGARPRLAGRLPSAALRCDLPACSCCTFIGTLYKGTLAERGSLRGSVAAVAMAPCRGWLLLALLLLVLREGRAGVAGGAACTAGGLARLLLLAWG